MLNVAPTQLRLNGWAFVRCFELLCQNLEILPTLEKFFCFFESRVNKRSYWWSLSNVADHNLITIYNNIIIALRMIFLRFERIVVKRCCLVVTPFSRQETL